MSHSSNRIDVHTHMIPAFWAEALGNDAPVPEPDWNLESTIAMMDRLGIRVGVISLPTPAVMTFHGQERIDMTRKINTFGMDLVKKGEGRIGYFVTVPMPDVAATLEELRRVYEEYHEIDGVILISNYSGAYLGDPKFAPVWDDLERRQAAVFVHPAVPEIEPLPGLITAVVDFPMDTTRMAVNLVTSGITSRCPSVKIILAHAGGFLPFAATRFAVLLANTTMKDKSVEYITDQLKTFYLDTALSTPDGLPSLLAWAKPDHILFGSDNPYISPDQQQFFTDELDHYQGFRPRQLEMINSENAEAIFPRLRMTSAST